MSYIIVKKKNHKYRANLIFNDITYECLIGRAGIGIKRKEGDGFTPKGLFRFKEVYFRSDRIDVLKTNLPKKIIQPSMGWSTDTRHKKYNQLIKKPYNFIHENLFLCSKSYDIVVSINFNTKNRVPYKGSAIFLHCIGEKESFTEGCIAVKKNLLIELISRVTKSTRLLIC